MRYLRNELIVVSQVSSTVYTAVQSVTLLRQIRLERLHHLDVCFLDFLKIPTQLLQLSKNSKLVTNFPTVSISSQIMTSPTILLQSHF